MLLNDAHISVSPPAIDVVGEALAEFDAALDTFRQHVPMNSDLGALIFAGADEWIGLLTYKLVPHLAGEGCLVAAIAGGTNTGKSTVFNLLLHKDISPVRSTAAATCRPLLAGNERRYDECLQAKLVPEFTPRSLNNPEAVITGDVAQEALFVTCVPSLPDRLVLLDTPDVDSIDRQNWVVADNIRAAGDVLVAVLTGEKYKDDRVVDFFRRAHAAGREILPLMNKANPENNYEIARMQLQDFAHDVGLEDPHAFVIPHDFSLAKNLDRDIDGLDNGPPLRNFLESMDVHAIKQRVFHDTVAHFAMEAQAFIDRTREAAEELRRIAIEFDSRAQAYAENYDPAPGAAVGGLFHEFVQSKRGPIDQAVGAASRTFVRGVSFVGRTVASALFKRAALETTDAAPGEPELHRIHQEMIERIARELASSFFESARNLRPPADRLVLQDLDALDVDQAVAAIVRQTLRADNISDEFREHAHKTMEDWWYDNTGRRRVIEALDKVLLLAPAAIAVPISIHTGGIGVPEAIAVTGPFVQQFVTRVIEYQFGDAMFDFLSPWRAEQRIELQRALRDNLVAPALASLNELLAPLQEQSLQELERPLKKCRTAL